MASKISGDSVRAYLRDIGRIPLLEHDEEILLGRQVQRLMQLEEMKKELSLLKAPLVLFILFWLKVLYFRRDS